MAAKFDPSKMRRSSGPVLGADFLTSFTGGGGIRPDGAVQEIPVDQLDPWQSPDHQSQPFQLYQEEQMQELAQNIAEHGVINPCIVRPMGSRYQILAGHNRTAAAKLAGLTTVPCLVREADDDTAALFMVDTNLYQREEILPSERAAAYAIKLAIYRRQGKRSDLTGEEQETAARRVAAESGDSARTIQRYARLNELKPELLEMVDEGGIPVTVGSDAAGLSREDQSCLYQAMLETDKRKLTAAQMEEIQILAEHGEQGLETQDVVEILAGPKKTGPKMQKMPIPQGSISKKIWKELKKDETLQKLLLETVERYTEERRQAEQTDD